MLTPKRFDDRYNMPSQLKKMPGNRNCTALARGTLMTAVNSAKDRQQGRDFFLGYMRFEVLFAP